MSTTQIHVPDIGADSAEVIEILVAEGDQITEEQSIIVLESDKASMEVPSPAAGQLSKLLIKVGDALAEGDLIAELELAQDAQPTETAPVVEEAPTEETATAEQPQQSGGSRIVAYQVPDIGSDSSEVIELPITVGERLNEGDTICVAESDKASLEIPAEAGGVVVSIAIAVGDNISQGDALIELEVETEAETETEASVATTSSDPEQQGDTPEVPHPPVAAEPEQQHFLVPDIGSDTAEVIELSIALGEEISEGDTICVAESDKASLEVPAEASGKVLALHIKEGDSISQGDALIDILVVPSRVAVSDAPQPAAAEKIESTTSVAATSSSKPVTGATRISAPAPGPGGSIYAGPAVRKLARELGVDLSKVSATGARGRVLKDDLHNYVKKALALGGAAQSAAPIPSVSKVDWGKFGEIHTEPMSKIHRLTADNMSRCWLNVPHVTQFDDADVTEIEEYRQSLKAEGAEKGIKMTPVAFLIKLAAKALVENPKFNSSIHEDGKTLVFRNYCHIGLAVDTPVGLMVPVIRDADQKDIWQLASEVMEMATKAKEGKLKPNEMQGACFTISSLGAIGGRGFTPIVPSPQVGILGVSKTSIQPVWDGSTFVPRKLMPLALSYDHRAVNGGDAGRFLTFLVEQFSSVDNLQ